MFSIIDAHSEEIEIVPSNSSFCTVKNNTSNNINDDDDIDIDKDHDLSTILPPKISRLSISSLHNLTTAHISTPIASSTTPMSSSIDTAMPTTPKHSPMAPSWESAEANDGNSNSNAQRSQQSAQHDNNNLQHSQNSVQHSQNIRHSQYSGRDVQNQQQHHQHPQEHQPENHEQQTMYLNCNTSESTSFSSIHSSSSMLGGALSHSYSHGDINNNDDNDNDMRNTTTTASTTSTTRNDSNHAATTTNNATSRANAQTKANSPNISSSTEKGNTVECSRRLVEYFVVVSSVPRMIHRRRENSTASGNGGAGNPPNTFETLQTTKNTTMATTTMADGLNNKVKDSYFRAGGGHYEDDDDDDDGYNNEYGDDVSVESMTNPRSVCSRASHAHSNVARANHAAHSAPPPPPAAAAEYAMNPRMYARMESRWVHLQDGGVASGGGVSNVSAAVGVTSSSGNGVGSSDAANVTGGDGNGKHTQQQQEQMHHQQQENERTNAGNNNAQTMENNDTMDQHRQKFPVANPEESPRPKTKEDDSSFTAPPPPMESPAASTGSASAFTAVEETPTSRLKEKMKKNNLFRSRSEKKKIALNMNTTKVGLKNIEKKLESKIKAMKIKMSSSLEKQEESSSQRQYQHKQQHSQEQEDRDNGYGTGDEHKGDDHSESSYSSLSESNLGELPPKPKSNNTKRKLQITIGDSSTGASTFRPSQTPTSARKVFPPPPPPPLTPSESNFPNTPTWSVNDMKIGGGGASENIRMGFEYDLRDREFNDDIDDCVLEPVITAQYPPVDHPDQPLNPMLPQFCHPQGIEYIVPSHEYKMPTVHHFVLTDSGGGKLYGTCLTVYEEFTMLDGAEEHEDDMSLPSVRSEQQERARVEISINGSPQVVRPRRRSKSHKYYAPRVLCLLSTWPYLSAFRTYLTELYRVATCTTNYMKAPIERYILNICAEVPAPPPGSFEVQLSILDSTIRFWAPPADQPIPYVSLPYGILFECLDIGNVLFAWYSLACERKILLVSSQLSLLTVCAEILCSMLFPMRWSHLYIPVLPRFLSPMLDAPMPYLCGISRENFPHAVGDISEETVVVDLDRNIITMGQHTPDLPSLPHRRKLKLEAALEKHAGEVFWKARGLTKALVEEARASGDENELAQLLGKADAVWDEKICTLDDAFKCSPAPDSMSLLYDDDMGSMESDRKQSRWDAVQEAFLRFYVAMLKDYRKYLPPVSTNNRRSSWRSSGGLDDGGRFLVEDFMKAQRPEFQPFLEELIGTQQFDDFITKRLYNAGNAPDVTFFDQSIDAKKNRSKLKLKKVETPFLHSANAHRDLKRIDAIEPNIANLPHFHISNSAFDAKSGTFNYETWPESFDESFFGKPRPIPSIITAEFDRRSALAAMLRQKHGLPTEGSLPGSTNPSPEATAFVLFFVTFSQIIGKEWVAMGEQYTSMGVNMLDEEEEEDDMRYYPGSGSSNETESFKPDEPWRPKVNPPWMAGENFQTLHSNLRPEEKTEEKDIRPDEVINEISPAPGFTANDCGNVCANCDLGKAIDPSTFIGLPWAATKNVDSTKAEHTSADSVHQFPSYDVDGACPAPVCEEMGAEVEKARAIAKAQVDLGFNTLKMMRARKVPSEATAYKALIDACGRCGITHRASQLMEMMTQDGLAVDSEVYFSFIRAFSNADGSSMIPYQQSKETASEYSSLPSDGDRRASMSDDPSLGSGSMRKDMTKGINGLYTAMSSATNRRAFKKEKMQQVKRFFNQGLTKHRDLIVTHSIKTQLELSHCILEDLYQGLVIDTDSDACPKCSCVLNQDHIILGWEPCEVKDYSTTCPSCKHRFVPKFSVMCDLPTFEGSQGKGTTLYCDYLSPWVLLREIKNLISKPAPAHRGLAKPAGMYRSDSAGYQVGIENIIDPAFRQGSDINATLWWNLIVTFSRFKIPFTFLLQGSYKDQQLIMPTLEDM